MKLPYRYRGPVMLALLFAVLPWTAWHFALRDTADALLACCRLSRELAAAVPSRPSQGVVMSVETEQLLSGRLLDTLRRHALQGVVISGYLPLVGEVRDGLAIHTARLELTGSFHALLPTVRVLERHLPCCRIRSLEWRVRTTPKNRNRQLVLTIHIQQIVSENNKS